MNESQTLQTHYTYLRDKEPRPQRSSLASTAASHLFWRFGDRHNIWEANTRLSQCRSLIRRQILVNDWQSVRNLWNMSVIKTDSVELTWLSQDASRHAERIRARKLHFWLLFKIRAEIKKGTEPEKNFLDWKTCSINQNFFVQIYDLDNESRYTSKVIDMFEVFPIHTFEFYGE